MTASGSGFIAGEPIEVTRDDVTIANLAAGPDGSFSVRVDISGVQNGVHEITAIGTLSGFAAVGVFDVEPQVCATESGTTVVAVVAAGTHAAVVVVAGNSTSLATTGFPTAPVLAAGVLALLVGTMLVVVTRHRRSVRASYGPSDNTGPRHR